jgi:hypothetical protein
MAAAMMSNWARLQAADDQACRSADGADEGERPDSPALFGGLIEQPDNHAKGDRGRHRTADALDEPDGDQHPGADRQPARQRGEGEHHEAREKHALPAKQVSEPARTKHVTSPAGGELLERP